MNRVYTGYKNYFLAIKSLKNGKYVIDSKDGAFVDYYIGDEKYDSYIEALNKINEIKKTHNLSRFDIK